MPNPAREWSYNMPTTDWFTGIADSPTIKPVRRCLNCGEFCNDDGTVIMDRQEFHRLRTMVGLRGDKYTSKIFGACCFSQWTDDVGCHTTYRSPERKFDNNLYEGLFHMEFPRCNTPDELAMLRSYRQGSMLDFEVAHDVGEDDAPRREPSPTRRFYTTTPTSTTTTSGTW
jgi:hypothetical protein